ncbi:DUF4190 domain-containing protein [Catellatospora chokoriensis]|uniref:DUF4190 domain-containing protein n=1 Tax=Catellatospora chokoriensis TaxID=310353 RepID=A0A8J3K2W3_9ACTN|nr:DUF4190 domain-containing protein [Catellatospora chokoriensis]GIF89715.1 hypothetical protein Cch02nite_31590 [Catellatospora chokoriensis]
MTDPTAPPPPSPDPGTPQPAFPAPAPLTFGPADPAAANAQDSPATPAAAPGSPAASPVAAPGHWPNPYQAAAHHPAAGHPTGGWPQVPGQPLGQPNPYGAYPPPGYAPYPYVYLQRRTNGMAIGAMVTALAGAVMLCFYGVPALILGPLGAILGHVARRKIRESGEEGDGMALTGIIVGWIATALGLLIIAAIVALIVFSAESPGYYREPAGAF